MNIIKLLFIFILCLPSFAGIKATRSATNPATYIDSSGVIQLLILSNKVRPAHYYDLTGFHQLAGWLKEDASTNYVLNSYFSIDSNSDGLADGYTKNYGTATLETCSINNITGGKSQKIVYTYTGSEASYSNILYYTTANDSIDCSAGNITVTFSCFIKGDLSGFSTTSGISFFVVDELNNAGTNQRNAYAKGITTASTYITANWIRMVFTFNCTDTDTRKLRFYFFQKGATAGTPAAGQTINFEIYGVQIEKKSSPTSFITTTTSAVTRNAESYKCRKFAD